MTKKYEEGNLILRLWYASHRTRALLKMCEDQIYGEYNLTTEQYALLSAGLYLGYPARPTDIAKWLGHSTNSVSMLVDRMVKAGLLRRVRDRGDRRVVNVFITTKAENALQPATRAGWEFIQKITSPLSNEDKGSFIILLNKLTWEASNHINPGTYTEEMIRNASKRHDN